MKENDQPRRIALLGALRRPAAVTAPGPRRHRLLSAIRLLLLPVLFAVGRAPDAAASPVPADWTAPQRPFRIAGNLYYVGSRELGAYLVVTPAGNILINTNLASSPPAIRASVAALGLRWRDTRILLNSQAHSDHAGGNAQVVRETGARVMIMDGDVAAIETGDARDFAGPDFTPFAPVHVDRVLHDGSTVQLGGTVLTAHRTAGHTRGCTAWTLKVTDHGRPLNVVIVGGLSAPSEYRLVATPAGPPSYPGILSDFRRGFAVERSLPCDIFLGAHGAYFDMQSKLARMPRQGSAVWIDPAGYRSTIAEAEAAIAARVAAEEHHTGS
jgi:metallo-beta-lactamase class B